MTLQRLTPEEYDARFDALSRQLRKANLDKIDECYEKLVRFMANQEDETASFLERCSTPQIQTALVVLDLVATVLGTEKFIQALIVASKRFPQFKFQSAIESARHSYARAAMTPTPEGKSRREDFEDLQARAEKGDPEAQFQVALRLYFGRGVNKDEKIAQAYAQRAVENGFAPATLFRDLP